MPRARPVECHASCSGSKRNDAWTLILSLITATVSLHGASPWHPGKLPWSFACSSHRELPRDKPVASRKAFLIIPV